VAPLPARITYGPISPCFGAGNGPGLPGSASRSARGPGRQGAEFSLRSQELPAAASASRRWRSRARALPSPCHTNGNRSDDGHDSGRPLVRGGNLPAICRRLTRGAPVPSGGNADGRSGGAARRDGCRFGRRVERAFDVSHRGRFPRPFPARRARRQPIRAERQRPAKELVQHSSARGHVAGVPPGFRRHCRDRAPSLPPPRRGRMWAWKMSRWVTVHRHSAVGPPAARGVAGRPGPHGNGPWPVSPAAPGNRWGSRGSGEAASCIPGQLAAKNACSATMGTRSHTCFCLLSTHCRSVATPCSRVLLEGGDRRRLIRATVFSLSVLHSVADACC
jgi:hypothetical protein